MVTSVLVDCFSLTLKFDRKNASRFANVKVRQSFIVLAVPNTRILLTPIIPEALSFADLNEWIESMYLRLCLAFVMSRCGSCFSAAAQSSRF